MKKRLLISLLTTLVIGVLAGGGTDPEADAIECLTRYSAYRQSLIELRETCLRETEMAMFGTAGMAGSPETPEDRRSYCFHEPDNYCKSAQR